MNAIVEKKISSSYDEAEQFNQLVKFEEKVSGYMDARENWIESEYAVQITTEPGGHGDFVGIYNLDGDQLNVWNRGGWTLVEGDEIANVPAEVLKSFEDWN